MKLYSEEEIARNFPELQRGNFLKTTDINVDGIRTRFADYGKGSALLLIHGFPETLQGWRHCVPELSEYFRVIAPDVIGCGKTTRPIGCKYSPEEVAEHLKSFLHLLNIKHVYIAGVDTGVAWTIMLASQYPEIVDGIVLAAGTVLKEDIHSWEISLMATPVLGILAVYSPFLGFTIKHGLRKGFVNKRLVSKEMYVEYIHSLTFDGGRMAAIKMIQAIIKKPDFFWKQRLQQIRCPVLLIWADQDAYFPLQGGEHLKNILGNSTRLEIIHSCGHFLQEEKPEEFNRILKNFLIKNHQ